MVTQSLHSKLQVEPTELSTIKSLKILMSSLCKIWHVSRKDTKQLKSIVS